MNVGLTGITGLTGWHVFEDLRTAGHRVMGLVRDVNSPTARWMAQQGALLIQGQMADTESLSRFMREADAVVHCGYSRMEEWKEPRRFMVENTFGSLHMIDLASQKKIPFIFISSEAVFNGLPANSVLAENSGILPNGGYSAWKVATEAYLVSYRREQKLRCTALRPGHIYGLRPPPDVLRSPHAAWASAVLNNEPLQVKRNRMHSTPVAAVARAVVRCLEPDRMLLPAYTIVEDKLFDTLELAKALVAEARSSTQIPETPAPAARSRLDNTHGAALVGELLQDPQSIHKFASELIRTLKKDTRIP